MALAILAWLLWPRGVGELTGEAVSGVGRTVIAAKEYVEDAEGEGDGREEKEPAVFRETLPEQVERAWETAGEDETVAEMVRRRLEGFGVIDVEMEGWTIAEVVAWLKEQLVELGSEDLELMADVEVRGVAKGTVTIVREGQANGWAVLGLAAAQAGMRVEVGEDGQVVLLEDPDGGDVAAAEAALARGLPGVQVRLNSRLIELQEDGVLDDQVLSDEEVQLLVRQLSQTQGVDLLTAPTVVTRAGQEARVEIGKTVGADGFEGIQLGSVPMVAGEQYVRMDGTIDLSGLSAELSESGASVTEYGTVLVNGQTAALLAVDGANGKKVLALVTGSLQDPSGRAVALPGLVGE